MEKWLNLKRLVSLNPARRMATEKCRLSFPNHISHARVEPKSQTTDTIGFDCQLVQQFDTVLQKELTISQRLEVGHRHGQDSHRPLLCPSVE